MIAFALAAALITQVDGAWRHDVGTFIMPAKLASTDEIDLVVKLMEDAVRKGDRTAYLGQVSSSDPFLLAEQTHFADKLGAVELAEFDLDITEPVVEGELARTDMTMTWRIPDWSGGERWSVTTPVVFRKEHGLWRYGGEDMKVLQADGFQVRYFEGFEETAEDVAAAFPAARAHADDVLGVDDTGPQVVKLYAERRQVVASVYLGVADWIPGWVEPGESMKFVWTYTRGDGWKGALAHEYGHVATFALGDQPTNIPWWAAEGVAELASERFKSGYGAYVDALIRGLAEDGELRDWSAVANFDATHDDDFQWAYHQGHHMTAYITETFGADRRNAWLRDMARGVSLEDATQAAFRIPFAELDDRWREHAGDASRPDPDRERTIAAITDTLDAMEVAVLAGDKQGYLAHVSDDDPVFHREQINWAADFDHHIPAAFELTIDDVEITDAWAEADLTMSWTMPEKAPREVDYRVGFVFDEDAWKYAGETWDQAPGKGVVALCAPGLNEVGRLAVEVFPGVRDHVQAGFGVDVKEVQQIKVYGSMRHLQASIYLSYEDPLGGWNEPGEAIKILSRRRTSAGALRNLLAHEFGHVATFTMGDKATIMPWWVLEGVAELAAEHYSGDRASVDNQVRAWAKADALADWNDMADFRNTPDRLGWHVYKQSQHFIGWLSERYGREKRNQWLTAMAGGASLEDATRQTFDAEFTDLDAIWRDTLNEGG